MQVAENFKSFTVKDLTIDASALYLLSGPTVTDAARHDAIEKAETGKHSTKAKRPDGAHTKFSGATRRCGVTGIFRPASRPGAAEPAGGPRGHGAESRACPGAAT